MGLFWSELPKIWVIRCVKTQFQVTICKFWWKIAMEFFKIIQIRAKRRRLLKFLCQILYKCRKMGLLRKLGIKEGTDDRQAISTNIWKCPPPGNIKAPPYFTPTPSIPSLSRTKYIWNITHSKFSIILNQQQQQNLKRSLVYFSVLKLSTHILDSYYV